jgi:hypothetical protein
MVDFYTQHSSEIWSFVGGLLTGGIGGSFITLKISGRNVVQGGGSLIDQSSSSAGGDIVGGNKTSGSTRGSLKSK